MFYFKEKKNLQTKKQNVVEKFPVMKGVGVSYLGGLATWEFFPLFPVFCVWRRPLNDQRGNVKKTNKC